ncbi:DNA primase [Patescibacteria group bacterium]|nr:DNA primase [Patescibacteria group bacterium]
MAGDTVAEIKERLSIQDIISPYVKLARAGKSLVGLCPFHKEKTPSFHVSPERGSWHCFGCGEGGDGFSFIEKIEGVDFKGALKILAEKAGVTLIYQSGDGQREDASKREKLFALMSRAGEWYAGKLPNSPAEAYARSRAMTDETIAAWRLGYAPDGWRALLEALTAEGFSVSELLAAGLVKEADGKPGTYYDRFRNRLMFPIRDAAGRIVAFTGRALPSEDSTNESQHEVAKYLNSPETDLYRKSEILFGMDRAKEAIRTRKYSMLVEGQIDVLLAHQAGFNNAVALSGTALSVQHLRLMKRFSENLMLVLDADPAGLAATARSAGLALRQGQRVKAARLPRGKDPADLISEGPQEFAACVAAAKPIVEFFLVELVESEPDTHRLLRRAESIVLPLLAAMPSPMEREHFIQSTARTFGISSEAVHESLKSFPGEPPVMLESRAQARIAAPIRPIREIRGEQLRALVHAYSGTELAQYVQSEYCRITEAREFPSEIPSESALFSVEQLFGDRPGPQAANELLRAFEAAVIREAYERAVANLRRAESSGEIARIEEAQRVCAELSARLAKSGG